MASQVKRVPLTFAVSVTLWPRVTDCVEGVIVTTGVAAPVNVVAMTRDDSALET